MTQIAYTLIIYNYLLYDGVILLYETIPINITANTSK
ncbi:hypothetical protein HNQ94_002321 [Salirhabdus euzebyi]|uniref:Uncharacterized protein n=1 Tax=Salirhabdus euzebyi TaxID=394506 RepID=A0A841Q635_9BACI|nr:hypothetical protein [Salirhabdus euzebyi]